MNKKLTVLIVVLLVCALAWSYRQKRREQLAAALIADAYAGDLIAVKNDLEDGAPLDYTLLFEDEERQYAGADFTPLHAAAPAGMRTLSIYCLMKALPLTGKPRTAGLPFL